MNKVFLRFAVLCLGVFIGSNGWLLAETKESAAFDKLRTLNGDWQGTVAWAGQQPSEVAAHYYITGNGSAVVEDLSNGMSSVYHLDGKDLRVTHFCAAQNQPRLKATAYDPDNSGITFSFVDITNLSSPKAGHVQSLDLKFLTADHIRLQFHFVSDGKVKDELLDLKRKK
jgi:hypothetical protein